MIHVWPTGPIFSPEVAMAVDDAVASRMGLKTDDRISDTTVAAILHAHLAELQERVRAHRHGAN